MLLKELPPLLQLLVLLTLAVNSESKHPAHQLIAIGNHMLQLQSLPESSATQLETLRKPHLLSGNNALTNHPEPVLHHVS